MSKKMIKKVIVWYIENSMLLNQHSHKNVYHFCSVNTDRYLKACIQQALNKTKHYTPQRLRVQLNSNDSRKPRKQLSVVSM